jgi:hypothetical protein
LDSNEDDEPGEGAKVDTSGKHVLGDEPLAEVSAEQRKLWRSIVDTMMKKNAALGAVLAQAVPMEVGEGTVRFGIEAGSFYERQARTDRAGVLLKEVIGQLVGADAKIVIERIAPQTSGQGPRTVYEELEQEERLELARKRKAVEQHPLVRAAIDELGAEILRIKFPEK